MAGRDILTILISSAPTRDASDTVAMRIRCPVFVDRLVNSEIFKNNALLENMPDKLFLFLDGKADHIKILHVSQE
jgi:hypothetical protein